MQYTVFVQAEDYITVEAENTADAEARAEAIFKSNPPDINLSIIHIEDVPNEPEESA